jgi:hypothetical protein
MSFGKTRYHTMFTHGMFKLVESFRRFFWVECAWWDHIFTDIFRCLWKWLWTYLQWRTKVNACDEWYCFSYFVIHTEIWQLFYNPGHINRKWMFHLLLIDKAKINHIEIYFLSATWKKEKNSKTNPPLSFNAEHIPSPNNIFKILRSWTQPWSCILSEAIKNGIS